MSDPGTDKISRFVSKFCEGRVVGLKSLLCPSSSKEVATRESTGDRVEEGDLCWTSTIGQ